MAQAQLGEPTVTQVISGGRRKLHYIYPNRSELIEELDVNTNEVLCKGLAGIMRYSEEMETSQRIRRGSMGV